MPKKIVIVMKGKLTEFAGKDFTDIEDVLHAVGARAAADEIIVESQELSEFTKDAITWWAHCVDTYIPSGTKIDYYNSPFTHRVADLSKGNYKHPNSHFHLGHHTPEQRRKLFRREYPELFRGEYSGEGEDF